MQQPGHGITVRPLIALILRGLLVHAKAFPRYGLQSPEGGPKHQVDEQGAAHAGLSLRVYNFSGMIPRAWPSTPTRSFRTRRLRPWHWIPKWCPSSTGWRSAAILSGSKNCCAVVRDNGVHFGMNPTTTVFPRAGGCAIASSR